MTNKIFTENIIKTNCKKCGHSIEIIDMEGIMYIDFCENCGYESNLDYFTDPRTKEIKLMDREDAIDIGAIYVCPKCKCDMTKEEKKEAGVCIVCQTMK